MRHGHERRPVKIGVLMVPDVERREIDENGAEEGHGDAYRADGDVLPRGFERSTCSAVPDKEGGDDRCSLDCYPHDPHVSGHHGEEHGGHESLDQHAVERCVTLAAATGDYLSVERCAQFDEEGDAGSGEKGDQGDAVVDEKQADDLGDGLAPDHHGEEPDEQSGETEGNQPAGRCRDERDYGLGGAIGKEGERRGTDQRGRDIHDWSCFPTGRVAGHDPAQQGRDDHSFGCHDQAGHHDEDGVVLAYAEDESDRPESETLDREGLYHRGERAAPQCDRGADKDHSGHAFKRAGVGRSVHRTTSAVTAPSTARTKPPASSSGTRKSRSFAVKTSKVAMAIPARATLPASAPSPMTILTAPGRSATPQGTRRLTSRPRSRVRRMDSPRVTSPRSGPAYSRTMAS